MNFSCWIHSCAHNQNAKICIQQNNIHNRLAWVCYCVISLLWSGIFYKRRRSVITRNRDNYIISWPMWKINTGINKIIYRVHCWTLLESIENWFIKTFCIVLMINLASFIHFSINKYEFYFFYVFFCKNLIINHFWNILYIFGDRKVEKYCLNLIHIKLTHLFWNIYSIVSFYV